MTGLCGIVLAGGAGTRFGGPKALARAADGAPWVRTAVETLREGGCARVVVVLGAGAGEASALVPDDAQVAVAEDWAEGVAASLRAGIRAAGPADAVVVLPVDTPDTPPSAVRRVVAAAAGEPRSALAQAVYGTRPGHPVLVGARHLAPLAASVSGDRGARPYLVAHGAVEVDCSDLWSGDDIDRR
ncbi:NTP transferase domain-containing protein [Microbacterium betulae]|uniref:NTP transferase domain-containing protein n=1 Tax=Microbacterium betulae TaxID=2981139 RepID=A0AA97FHN2_9MICO|nr:NTP transferase domain-containing protein [Microbacterium sp. AB]WOF22744.1 NTP transferase domain-containing protein [Microbacterium sp. AB]